jgi:hypothetical protein
MDESGAMKRTGSFALASSLSTICRVLNVTVIRDWNSGLPEYWGDVGHYTIGFFACDQISGKIGKLMKANQENVSYPKDTITSKKGIKLRGPDGFVGLADVPDRVWKIPGGEGARGNSENPNHFADMDQKLPDSPNKGKTLLQLCDDPGNIDPDVWMDYYNRVKDGSKGLLPFRVWQFFDEMADAVAGRKPRASGEIQSSSPGVGSEPTPCRCRRPDNSGPYLPDEAGSAVTQRGPLGVQSLAAMTRSWKRRPNGSSA